jgi:spermidine/putrescine transport system ATP-binding protein
VKGRPKAEIRQRVDEMLAMVELSEYADRSPAQLSGGQQQRVALARMLATDPRVLLFDEPLSALDRNLRDTLKYSILDLQRRTKKTAIYVTHDQSEAFAISDRIFVMNQGHIEQAGKQLDIYLRPQSEFVANFVGDNNSVHGAVSGFVKQDDGARLVEVTSGAVKLLAIDTGGLKMGDAAVAFVRPETIEVLQPGEQPDNPYVLEGSVEQVVFEGPTVRLEVDVDGTPFLVEVGGLRRLRLIGADQKRIRIWPREVSAVRDREAAAA